MTPIGVLVLLFLEPTGPTEDPHLDDISFRREIGPSSFMSTVLHDLDIEARTQSLHVFPSHDLLPYCRERKKEVGC